MSLSIKPVILCGGSGTRLWPLSRTDLPKQFLNIFGNKSFFQLAAERLLKYGDSLVVGNEDHRFIIMQQLQDAGINADAILLEPCGKNTAPALTLAALAASENSADPILVVTPADQIILDNEAFIQTITRAISLANDGAICLLGITPNAPETGYGYIKASDGVVDAFVEKPDIKTALNYLQEGGYFWNSGIFVLRASLWLAAIARFCPDILEEVSHSWAKRTIDQAFIRPDEASFAHVPAESIDYAVMEKCVGVFDLRVIPLASGWSDLGSWESVWQYADKDAAGNAIIGDGLVKNGENVFIYSSNRLVSVVGLSNIAVIETADAVLAIDKSRSQEVKQAVAELKGRAREEHIRHRKVHRPWGWYDSIDEGSGFKVKRIMVRAHASLSLQKHKYRAEHWVVVSGTAEVTCKDKIIMLHENQSTYIPLGEIHRVANPGDKPLEIIEVQSGSYLGEDDITRLEDNYGRKNV